MIAKNSYSSLVLKYNDLALQEKQRLLNLIRDQAKKTNVTLLFVTKVTEFNHAIALIHILGNNIKG